MCCTEVDTRQVAWPRSHSFVCRFMTTAEGHHGYTGRIPRRAFKLGGDPHKPATLQISPNVGWRFWLAIVLTGLGTGACAAALTLVLQAVQHFAWPGTAATFLDAADQSAPWRHIVVLLGAGLVTGAGQIVLVRLTSSNSIDITEAIWFSAGRLPALRTLGSAVLSVVVVGMGASLGREGAPKQVGAVIANALSDRVHLSDEQRRLLVACGAGGGMAAAYGVPLGGALFALEVLRGMLSLRLVLPALLTSVIAAVTAWLVLPNAPTYVLIRFDKFAANLVLALLIGPVIELASVVFVRIIMQADRFRPTHWRAGLGLGGPDRERGRGRRLELDHRDIAALALVRLNLLGRGRSLEHDHLVDRLVHEGVRALEDHARRRCVELGVGRRRARVDTRRVEGEDAVREWIT